MRFTKTLIFIFLIYIQISCETNERKSDLLGIWESYESHHSKTVLTFYKDSLILDGFGGDFHTKSKWTIDKSKIYLKNIRLKDTVLLKNLTYEYELNESKDTLIIRFKNGKEDDISKMRKVGINPLTFE